MLNDNFLFLVKWFKDHCDGDWEHIFGVNIETLDNPGWSVEISIQETELQEKKFKNIKFDRSEDDWVSCKIENGFFKGYCGVDNLPEVLEIFRNWAEEI